MKIKIRPRHWSLAIVALLLYLLVHYWPAIAKLLHSIFSATIPLLIGCVLAYIVNLLLRQYEHGYNKLFSSPRAAKFRRPVGILLAYLSIIVIIALVLSIVVPQLISCIKLLLANHSRVINKFIDAMQKNSDLNAFFCSFHPNQVKWGQVGKYIATGFGGTLKMVASTASSVASVVATAIIAIFFSIYLLIYKEKLARQCTRVLKTYLPKFYDKTMYVVRTFDDSYSSYIVGQCKDACLLGIACFIGMAVLRLPYASMIGAVTAITALIPIIGAIMGASVGVVIIFAISQIKAGIFLIFIIALQQLDNRVTYPLVVGKSIGLPSVWVFAAVIVGGGIYGIIGMMFTVPLFAAVYKLIANDVRRRQAIDKSSSKESPV